MTGTKPQLAEWDDGWSLETASPLAHLLHALNQPLTGLQCSLELADSGPRRTEEYVRVVREALDLTARMRVLVDAVRELVDACQPCSEDFEVVSLDEVLRDTVEELGPVARAQGTQICIVINALLRVRAPRCGLATLMFRFLESALSMTRQGSILKIAAAAQSETASLAISWQPRAPLEHSPFSRQELGLMIARAGWAQLGAEWKQELTGGETTCAVRMPLANVAAK